MKTKRFFVCTFLVLMLCFGAYANGNREKAPETAPELAETTVKDMVGREVTIIPGSYKRVVCIGAGALRTYSYIGSTDLLCGVEDIENETLKNRPKMFDGTARPYVIANEDVYKTLPSCGVGGPNAQAAEAEKILSCNPDIVISYYEDVDKENALQQQLGVPVITLRSGKDGVFSKEFADSLLLLGKIFKEEAKAQKLTAFIESETAEIKKRTSAVSESQKPTVYICGLGNWGTTNYLMTAQNYMPFTVANIKNAVTDLAKTGIQSIEKEKFETLGPSIDILIIDDAAIKNIKPQYKQDPQIFDSVKAVQNGNVYLQLAYNAYYTNYELALANTWWMAKVVYPQLFADIDMTQKLNEITEVFLGKPMDSEIYAKPTSFGGYQKINPVEFFK